MPSDYKQITDDNIEEYGKGKRHLAYLGDLYPDRTHFIFELLQNAEDAGASKVKFSVFDNRLELMHNGRCFTAEDVRGVCGIGEGQKADDLTKIGRFGIGFKSVYAYTNSPEIHSGDEHFGIETYVRPHQVKPRRVDGPWTTLFVFHFNKDKPDRKTSFREISDCLSNMETRTLLFLRKITEVEYTSGETNGTYLRGESTHGSARTIDLKGGNDNETWLVFERLIRNHKVYVEMGFRMNTETKTIEREYDTPLVVYFPTEKHTGLGFYIQGPYRTTLARDNVPKDDPWNRILIEETAKLTVESMRQLKRRGLLTVSLLDALPIDAADFGPNSMFHPIFESVKEALTTEDLLPADDGSFVAAQNAMLARGTDLIKLLNRTHLVKLFARSDDVRWLSPEITQSRTPCLWRYLISELKVNEVTPDFFADSITQNFLTDQSDEWTIEFYCWLLGRRALWKSEGKSDGILLSKEILRLRDGSHVRPFLDGRPNAFLDTSTPFSADASVPLVKAELTRHSDARGFLEALGVPRFDIVEDVIERVLPKYENNDVGCIPAEKNRDDLLMIEYAYRSASDGKRSRLLEALSSTAFILCTVPATGKQEYRTADQVYFRSDELCMYFEGNATFAYVDLSYESTLFAKLGVGSSVRIKRTQRIQDGHVVYTDCWGNHVRGNDGFDLNLHVDGLEDALRTPNIKKSVFIWNKVAIPNYRSIHGKVESSRRRDYVGSETIVHTSHFGSLLMGKKWLPNRDGVMNVPGDLSVDDLPDSFERGSTEAEKLALKLGMKTEVDAELLRRAGVSLSALTKVQLIESASPEIQRQIDSLLKQGRARPEFPTGATVENADRRRTGARTQHEEAPPTEYERRSRSVRTTRGAIEPETQLRLWYTNQAGQMVCQICKGEMPFKRRDGKYYFERVEVLSKNYLPKENVSQFLALCPLCAARYKYFVKGDEGGEAKELHRALIDAGSQNPVVVEVPVKFDQACATLRFVPRHIIDLGEILRT